MKKWLITALLFAATSASAGTLDDIWTDVKANSSVDLGNNVAPFIGYDFKTKTLLDGPVTNIYTYRGLTLQAGLVKRASSSDTPSWAVGGSFNTHKILANLLNTTGVAGLLPAASDSELLKRLQVGPFYNYDFRTKVKHYGGYVAIMIGGK